LHISIYFDCNTSLSRKEKENDMIPELFFTFALISLGIVGVYYTYSEHKPDKKISKDNLESWK
jgi:hypothetical protein